MKYEVPVCPVCLEQMFSDLDGDYGPCPNDHVVPPVWIKISLWRSTARGCVTRALKAAREQQEEQRKAERDQADSESLLP